MYKNSNSTNPPKGFDQEQGWNRNTDLCMNVKTFLRSDRITQIGKDYQGVLTRDEEDHYRFIEILPPAAQKRNPRVYNCELFTISLRDDGSLRMNVKPIKSGPDFSVDGFALRMSDEIRHALQGLVGEVR